MRTTKIIVYGWNFFAERFRYQYIRRRDIIALVSDELPEYWYNVELIQENDFLLNYDTYRNDCFIYIAYSFDSLEYKDIKNKLESRGYEEFVHFLSVEAYNKKMVIINANCHMVPYAEYLHASRKFCEEYYIYPLDVIQNRKPVEIPECILKHCDVFIYQIVSEKNPYSKKISTNYTLSMLREDCQRIAVPNFAGGVGECENFYFPQLQGQNRMHPRIKYELGVFPCRDMIIEECLQRGLGIEKILEIYKNENLISHQEIQEGFYQFLNTLKIAEKKWSFKISDLFEEKNIDRILAAPGHPANPVLAEIGNRILNELGIKDKVSFEFEYVDEYPILKCVSKALEMKEDDYIRDSKNRKEDVLCDKQMDLEEYVKEYIYWTHGYGCDIWLDKIKQIVQGQKFILYRPTKYIQQLLNVMGEILIDTLESYVQGTAVIIVSGLLTSIKVKECVDLGVRVEDIYIVEMWDERKKELSKLLNKYSKVVLYGMGNDFNFILDEVNDRIAVCDKKVRVDYEEDGMELWSVETLLNHQDVDTCVYITSTLYGLEIQDELSKKRYPKDRIFLNTTSYEQVVNHRADIKVVPLVQSDMWNQNMENSYAYSI